MGRKTRYFGKDISFNLPWSGFNPTKYINKACDNFCKKVASTVGIPTKKKRKGKGKGKGKGFFDDVRTKDPEKFAKAMYRNPMSFAFKRTLSQSIKNGFRRTFPLDIEAMWMLYKYETRDKTKTNTTTKKPNWKNTRDAAKAKNKRDQSKGAGKVTGAYVSSSPEVKAKLTNSVKNTSHGPAKLMKMPMDESIKEFLIEQGKDDPAVVRQIVQSKIELTRDECMELAKAPDYCKVELIKKKDLDPDVIRTLIDYGDSGSEARLEAYMHKNCPEDMLTYGFLTNQEEKYAILSNPRTSKEVLGKANTRDFQGALVVALNENTPFWKLAQLQKLYRNNVEMNYALLCNKGLTPEQRKKLTKIRKRGVLGDMAETVKSHLESMQQTFSEFRTEAAWCAKSMSDMITPSIEKAVMRSGWLSAILGLARNENVSIETKEKIFSQEDHKEEKEAALMEDPGLPDWMKQMAIDGRNERAQAALVIANPDIAEVMKEEIVETVNQQLNIESIQMLPRITSGSSSPGGSNKCGNCGYPTSAGHALGRRCREEAARGGGFMVR